MPLVGIKEKFRLFPFRTVMGKIACHYPLQTLPHLLVRWFSCPFELFEPYVPRKGIIGDLGCGHGLLLYWLASFLPSEAVLLGFDIDGKKIDFARDFDDSHRIQFETKNITAELELRDVTCLILNDVLHMLSFPNQRLLLRRCFGALSQGGTLIIKEINAPVLWKRWWAGIQAYFVRDIFHLTRGEGFYPQPMHSFIGILESIGFKVESFPVHQGYVYPHMLYLCKKG